jgi:hypothetical protein
MRKLAFTASVLVLLAAQATAGLPLSDPLWGWMRPAATRAGVPLGGVVPRCGLPADSADGWSALTDRAARLGREGRHRLGSGWMGLDGLATLEAGRDDGTQVRAGTALRLQARICDDLTVHERLSVWSGSDERPPHHYSPYHLGREEGRHLYADWGYASWTPGPLGLSLGRMPQRWGPGRYTSLLLSSNSPALDMLLLSAFPADWLTFTGLTATVDSDSAAYLSLHRIDIRPAAALRIGLSESILYCSEGLELAYMNPFIPYYPVQWNERDDDNAFLCFDGEWCPAPGLSVWGELLIDDFQYQTEYDRPNKMAWTVGAEAAGTWGGWANLEYTRIDRYVYSQRRSCNYYLHDDRIIGSALGPDADRVTAGAGLASMWPLVLSAYADHVRKGEGTVYDGWPDSASTGEPFPSGTVEYRTTASLRLSAYPDGPLEMHGGLSRCWKRNADHQPGAEDASTGGWVQAVWNW